MKTLELPAADEGSDLDSMPELEDVPNEESGWNPFVAYTQRGYGNFSRRQGDLWKGTGTTLAGCSDSDVRGTTLDIRR